MILLNLKNCEYLKVPQAKVLDGVLEVKIYRMFEIDFLPIIICGQNSNPLKHRHLFAAKNFISGLIQS